jgi:DNA/RNA endonuclease YhcR with UshA esterase domain
MKKQLRLLLAGLFVMLASGVSAKDITFLPSEFTAATSADYSLTKDGVTMTVTSSTVTDSEFRIFKSQTITFKSTGDNLTKIVFTCTANGTAKYGPGNFAATDGYTFEADGKLGTWTGNASTLTLTAEAAQVRATQIVVTVGEGGGETPPDTPEDPNKAGTVNNPYTVAQANELLATMAPNVKSDVVYAKGKISKIDEVETVQFGNATFYISDTGSEDGQLEVYRCVFLEKSKFTATDQIKVGDEVIICGQLVNYRSSKAAETDPVTPEFTQGCYIYSLNGKTKAEGGETPKPQVTKISVAEALTAINALADGAKSENSFIVKGYIVGTPEFQRKADGTLYGNANFAIADKKGGTTTLTIFRAKNFENANFDEETILSLKEGDLVEVQGLLQKYVKDDVTTPELVSCYLISVSSGEGPEVTEPTAISVADALTAINALADGAKSSDEYIVKGYIVGAPEFQRKADGTLYGNANFTIADENGGATTLTIFRAKNFENASFDEETISTLKEGDLVEVKGLLQKYVKDDVTTPELVSCYLVSVNGKDAASVKTLKLDQDANAPAYNLGGKKVSTSYRGLIIRNGRKFINK